MTIWVPLYNHTMRIYNSSQGQYPHQLTPLNGIVVNRVENVSDNPHRHHQVPKKVVSDSFKEILNNELLRYNNYSTT